ncbi:hypothetical protein IHQ68_03780 [Chelatococcus sambhunathii]|uniref:Sulfotransferase family n=1 Tax=Chelatococcus sambhunathii TaxID=363953 RepID=A0ABU1DCI1_9HYPH|nr:hypothetical protein [Chelatococcus sambhunathii]MDR4305743.1 hypothetical protein [Chelatococcus sambhunathii]
MTLPTSVSSTPILGASIPRSGHGHLSRLMRRYYADDLRYCATYVIADCCKQTPCARTEGRPLVFQKSHDFAFRMPTDVEGALYLIQHRHPVPNAMSGAELRGKERGMKPAAASLAARWKFYDFLAERLAYYRRFHDKWIVTPPARSVAIDHARLEAHPAGVLRDIDAALGRASDEARIEETCETLAGRGGRKAVVYKPRDPQESAFFDRPALAAFEAAVIEECPGFGYAATLGGADWRTHPLWTLARLRHEYGRPLPRRRTAEFD